jgi:hypothetical protein
MRKFAGVILLLGLLGVAPGCVTTALMDDIQSTHASPAAIVEVPLLPVAVATDVVCAPVELVCYYGIRAGLDNGLKHGHF